MSEIDFRLLLITDRHAAAKANLTEVVTEAVKAGVKAVQLREKDMNAQQLFYLADKINNICNKYNSRLLINDRLDIATAIHSGGVHLPSNGIPPKTARKLLSADMFLGISTHSVEEARKAERDGVDYIVFGPVYATASKLRYGAPLGLEALHETTEAVKVPVFAVGGITPERATECRDAGAHGVAVISAIIKADDPAAVVRLFQQKTGAD
jgi:thiamine-phosphate pyrophosphorylase